MIGIAQALLVKIRMEDVSLWDENDYLLVGNVVEVHMSKVSP